jgi:nucleoside-diphosphate-sugar epimerase
MKVCVTGSNGFIASHIVKQLLDEGYIVNGCVRDATNEKKVNHLKEMDGASTGPLILFSTGNLGENENDDSESSSLFDDAIRDCDAIIHAATPIAFGVDDGKKQIYDPAMLSTNEILKSIERVASKTLKTFVLTSSMSAISPKPEPSIKTEDCWSDEKLQIENGNWYGATKTAQEKLVLEYIEDFTTKEGKPPFRFAAICPTVVFGPMLQQGSNSVNATMGYLQDMCKNGKGVDKETGLQNKAGNDSMSFIDVRDTASHHVKALQDPNAEGRYMSVTSTSLHWNDIFALLKELYPLMPDVPDCDDEVLVEPTKFDHTKMNTLNVNCRNVKDILRDAIEDLKSKGHL